MEINFGEQVMFKRMLFYIAVFIMALGLGYVAIWGGGFREEMPPAQDNGNNALTDPIEIQISKMSLKEKVGQLVLVGFEGYEIDAQVRELIEKYHVGGFILFKRNISSPEQTIKLTNSLKKSNAVNDIPLFLGIDEEGGSVSRLPNEFDKIPSNRKIGELDNGELSYQVGSVIGKAIKSLGFNMNFAPVLDINSNPHNPVIGDRAFGDNADIVARLGLQTIKGLQSQNIIPVVKHFPGHGDTSMDSHLGLPVVDNDLQRLKGLELLPFAAAIENQIGAVMTAHIILPQIDAQNPASLSPTIISQILRGDMQFDGVVISDDLTLGAIVNNYEIGAAAIKAIEAGSDIVLICHGYEQEKKSIEAIIGAVGNGIISPDRINRSVYRVLKLKQKYGLTDRNILTVNVEEINNSIKALNEYF